MMGQEPFRVPSSVPAYMLKTYEIRAPLETHFRPATCAEIDCPNYLNGWVTVVDESTELGQRQLHYIRHESGRKYKRAGDDGVASSTSIFEFEPGQRCFASAGHRIRVERAELFVVRDGDWRGNPTGRTRTHVRPADWLDDFGTHQLRVSEARERG